MNDERKKEIYALVQKQIAATLEGENNFVAKMSTISCMLKQNFPHFYWCGFYVVDKDKENELVVGPYQGTLGCLRIPIGKGVCGSAFKEKTTQLVADVHAIENHITCDPKSMSEIVVPLILEGKVVAVLDIDSDVINSFNEVDKHYLENILLENF